MSTETILPDLEHLPDVTAAVAADVAAGKVLVTKGEREAATRAASRTALTLRALQDLARDGTLGVLESVVLRGASGTTVTVVRRALFVQAALAPQATTIEVERALAAWDPASGGAGAAPGPAADARGEEAEEIALEVVPPDPGAAAAAAVGAPDVAGTLSAAVAQAAARADAWTSLRRTLVRGQLTDASALRDALARHQEAGAPPGAEPLDAAQRDRGMDALLEGIGSVLSGDAVGGMRLLKEVAADAQPSRSYRWLALHWSTLAALQCSNAPAARAFVRQGVLLSRALDAEAQAVSQWAAAEVLLADREAARALDWSSQARIRFERQGDTWGLARACFVEARILVAMGREDEASEAARRAWSYDPAWDEPPVFLARRALERGALDEAEETIRMVVGTVPAERIRLVAQAVRQGALAQADAVELLGHLSAPPSVASARALERLAHAAPRLAVPREALAWMLLKAGRYAEAGRHFTALAAARLPPTIRSSVMLGLGCVAHAQGTNERPEARLRAAVAASGAPPAAPTGAAPAVAAEAASSPALSSSIVSTPAGGAVFSGKLSVFAVPDLLEFLRSARRTGLLLCSAGAGTAALRFREGRIAGGASPATPGVGELLVRAGKLSALTLQAVLDARGGRARTDGVLGELLVREKLVAAEDVRRALREQIGQAIREIIGWRDGEFAFNREEPDGEPEIGVEVDPQEVLLNALKELDEAARTDGGR